jgi:hypothetical protein
LLGVLKEKYTESKLKKETIALENLEAHALAESLPWHSSSHMTGARRGAGGKLTHPAHGRWLSNVATRSCAP